MSKFNFLIMEVDAWDDTVTATCLIGEERDAKNLAYNKYEEFADSEYGGRVILVKFDEGSSMVCKVTKHSVETNGTVLINMNSRDLLK
jgi:hypothetical protein